MERDGDPAVVRRAEGPAILPLDPDGVLAILREGGVVVDDDGMRGRKHLCYDSTITFPGFLLIPGALVDEIPEGLQGITDAEVRREGDASDQGLDTLALAISEQGAEVDGRPLGLTSGAEIRHEAIGRVPEPMPGIDVKRWCLGAIHTLR
jgi:hypothetical protein